MYFDHHWSVLPFVWAMSNLGSPSRRQCPDMRAKVPLAAVRMRGLGSTGFFYLIVCFLNMVICVAGLLAGRLASKGAERLRSVRAQWQSRASHTHVRGCNAQQGERRVDRLTQQDLQHHPISQLSPGWCVPVAVVAAVGVAVMVVMFVAT